MKFHEISAKDACNPRFLFDALLQTPCEVASSPWWTMWLAWRCHCQEICVETELGMNTNELKSSQKERNPLKEKSFFLFLLK